MYTKTALTILSAVLAVQGAPFLAKRQGETRLISSGTAPPGCTIVSTSLFGIGIHKATDVPKAATFMKRQVTQGGDGQPAASSGIAPVTVLPDGQPNAPTATVVPITVLPDGQPNAPGSTHTMHPITQINDGQVQAYYSVPAITQIGDGQIQAPTATASPITQIGDGQIQAPTATAPAISQKTDGQPNAPTVTATGVTQASDAQPAASSTSGPAGPSPSVHMVACKTNSTLALTIENGVLYDGLRRQGYIAANYQFQFDAGVPQTGAIITSGFSLCSNGTLALGGSAIFWQCLSGTFYNLYDRDWAYQCEPVYLTALDLINCPA